MYAFIIEAGYTAPRTAYMLQSKEPVVYQFVSLDHMSRFLLASTIAHEDEQLGSRAGAFDWADLQARAAAYMRGEPDPSGSTIPQQLVKNMFLWEERENPTAVRKALEAGLATQYAYTLDDKRVLELYLNYAQFGPGLYGACAASWYYFDTPPWNMTEYQSAQLMGVLPLPDLVRRAPGGGIDLGPNANRKAWDLINGAANVWVPQQLEGMGGWKAAVATVGITDTAGDHADTLGNDDACSTMPGSVKERLAADFG
jgi:monofunctional biosynthetic peptidoglycan transglycosylase